MEKGEHTVRFAQLICIIVQSKEINNVVVQIEYVSGDCTHKETLTTR